MGTLVTTWHPYDPPTGRPYFEKKFLAFTGIEPGAPGPGRTALLEAYDGFH